MELQKLISDLLQGKVRVVSFNNVALGPDKGITADVLSALNFARLAFDATRGSEKGPDLSELIPSLCSMQMVENALAICHERGNTNFHFEVEEVYRTPLFERSLKSVSKDSSTLSLDYIVKLLKTLRSSSTSSAIIITRWPLVMTCLLLETSSEDFFVLFNPRETSEGKRDASLTISTSLPRIAKRAFDLFSFVHQPPQGTLDYKCAGHVFVPRASFHDPRAGAESLILSSLTLLSLREELEELTRDNEDLKGKRQGLERNILSLEVQLEEEKAKAKRASTWSSWSSKPSKPKPSVVLKQGFRSNHSSYFAGERDNPARSMDEIDPEMQFALQLQATFDAEHELLLKQKNDLIQTAQRQYHCGVCLDDFPEDDAVRISACGHEICRDCAQGHVCTKIEEHRFPVLCPVCMADHKNNNPGTITSPIVQLLGVSEKQWETWVEMEMAQFSIAVNCRKCHHSGFVDRDDLEAQSEIHCPFLSCDHVWCKMCQQTIEAGGPKHSCDGTAELDHLMTQQGWRYCPNCKTPIQKTSGCNHLSCISPGCNTHFCYRCGQTINRTAIPAEIQAGKTAHFSTCSLF
ncbi:hypothetical protein JVU11DRAFT_12952 [Chiua virens]|nr:hypothetical protein JVU11DRAFT_12952 [Chiua virens]